MLFIAILVLIVLYAFAFHYNYIRKFFMVLGIPGPTAYPFVGNGLLFVNKSSVENLIILRSLIRKHGAYFRLWLGTDVNIIVSDPKDAEIILSNPRFINKSTEYKFLEPWLNEGLLLSKGRKWYERRKIITPTFHFKILEQFVEIFDKLGNTVITNILNKYGPNDEVEFYPIMVLYALDVMCETAMGVNIDALSKPNSEYVIAVKEISQIVFDRTCHFLLRMSFIFKFSNLRNQHDKTINVLHDFTNQVIKQRRHELITKSDINQNILESDADDIGIKKKYALLDVLLNSNVHGRPLTDLEIREEVDTFMFEGHDTTTSAITFTLFNIARYPKVQGKCFREILDVFGDDKTASTSLKQLNNLHYMELVIKESLRLFPSVALIARKVDEDIHLTKGRVIPASANVAISILDMANDSSNFDNPNEFLPERFDTNHSNDIQNPFAYIPFSAGPRNCVGQKFAMLEIKSIVTKILRNYFIRLTDDCNMDPILSIEIILRPQNELKFILEPRIY